MLMARWWPPNCKIQGVVFDGLPRNAIMYGTCPKLSSPHRERPDCRFVVGPDVGVTGAELPKAIGAVPTISQKGWNRQFSTAHRPPNGAGKAIRAAECQGQTQK